ncbi:MAG: hypothetical protein II308_01670 [Muribaculaceae bacterium]|jgi:hypothetical protein|nr:hypothetical protein [Muribaculaceae bacterium]MBR4886053.1 hypothetical protein [Muribaculaceae bacterium]MEE1365940.1 hypothetical protein [Muribaculaceae bacterium]
MAEEFKYDEDAAVKFIKAFLPEECAEKFSDDDILFIMDCMWDFYEDNGYLEITADDTEEDLDIDKIVDYVNKAIIKDGEIKATKEELKIIINAELQYEESIGDFDL